MKVRITAIVHLDRLDLGLSSGACAQSLIVLTPCPPTPYVYVLSLTALPH